MVLIHVHVRNLKCTVYMMAYLNAMLLAIKHSDLPLVSFNICIGSFASRDSMCIKLTCVCDCVIIMILNLFISLSKHVYIVGSLQIYLEDFVEVPTTLVRWNRFDGRRFIWLRWLWAYVVWVRRLG